MNNVDRTKALHKLLFSIVHQVNYQWLFTEAYPVINEEAISCIPIARMLLPIICT